MVTVRPAVSATSQAGGVRRRVRRGVPRRRRAGVGAGVLGGAAAGCRAERRRAAPAMTANPGVQRTMGRSGPLFRSSVPCVACALPQLNRGESRWRDYCRESGSSPDRASTAGWCRPPPSPSISRSGRRTRFSVFKLPLTKVLGITGFGRPPTGSKRARLDLHPRHRLPRALGRRVRPVAGARRPAEGGVRGGLLLGRLGFFVSAARRPAPQHLAAVSGVRRARRMRARPGLHLARLDPDQVVPRPPGHGDGHGDHGIRRRGDDRGAAVAAAAWTHYKSADVGRASPRPSSRWA